MKILIVEDDESTKTALAALCGEYWRVQKCQFTSNIAQAIDSLKKERPDLIILDILLQGETCFPIVNFVRDKYFYDQPRIVVMSALNNGAQLAAENNICEYLIKPFSLESLEKLIFKK